MKSTKAIAGILSMALLLTSCGTDTSSKDDSSQADTTTTTTEETTTTTEETTTTTEETTTTEAETTETTTTTEDAGSEDEPQPEEPRSAEEKAAAQVAMDGFLKANADEDYAAMVKYYDVGLLYYMETGEMASEDELIQYLKDGETETGESVFSDYSTAEIGELTCYNSMAEEMNAFLASDLLKEGENADGEPITLDMAGNFEIDGMYTFSMSVEDVGEDYDYSMDMEYAVLRINGEWQVDIGLTLVWAFAQMAEDMGSMTE